MGITRAIGNAFTGLNASARAAEIVSRNLANAGVEGYTAKRLDLSHEVHGSQGAGVRVDGVSRDANAFATAARMRGEAGSERASTEAGALRRLADLMIDPGGGDGLAARHQKLEAALVTLADTPESAVNQENAVAAAAGVARKLNMLSGEVTRVRAELDSEIARQVADLNDAMRRIEALNKEIEATRSSGRDVTALEDERQRQVDRVNRIVPIRSSPDMNGGRLTTSAGGAILGDVTSREVAFTPSAVDDPLATLGGLTIDGTRATPSTQPDPAAPPASPLLAGGSLEALFRARDEAVPAAARALDGLARELATRFQDLEGWSDLDVGGQPTLTGLFTDGAAAFDAAADATGTAPGLASRLRVNAAFDPDAGGDPALIASGAVAGGLTRLPGGATPYPAALREAFLARPADGATPARKALATVVTEAAAAAEAAAGRSEDEAAFARGASTALREAELEGQAVDTDSELRDLLSVERAYAANAKVLEVVDAMLRRLLEI
jgi:flagellar hook-associated protein 1 FlgK